MGRKQIEKWAFLSKIPNPIEFKTPRAKFQFCDSTVSATGSNIERHFRDWKYIKSLIGASHKVLLMCRIAT